MTAEDIAEAISHFFTNQVSDVQAASLLMCMHFTGMDRKADVMAACAAAMMKAAAQVDADELRSVVEKRGRPEGSYKGGLVRPIATTISHTQQHSRLILCIV